MQLPVLFFAFSNDESESLDHLKEESRRIKEIFSPLNEQLKLEREESAELEDLFQNFLTYKNQIVIFHFAGHAGQAGLQLEETWIDGLTLADLIEIQAKNQLKLAVLNGCATEGQVNKLLQAGVKAVLATRAEVDDQSATQFSVAFYKALSQGNTLEEAFRLAAAIMRVKDPGRIELRNNFRGVFISRKEESFPWGLYILEGYEEIRDWRLFDSLQDPLIGLPSLPPEIDLPDTPFRGLNKYTREDAKVFFGRAHEIRTLFNLVNQETSNAILLFYGQSGAGKSSLIYAGLLPRLEESWRIQTVRKDHEQLIHQELSLYQEQNFPPTLLVFDQAEEIITLSPKDPNDALRDFFHKLHRLCQLPKYRCKVIISFRKEFLAEIEATLSRLDIPYLNYYLSSMQKANLVEVVSGLTSTSAFRLRYGLSIDNGLPEIIAADVARDNNSNIAPTIQLLLTKMWKEATELNRSAPSFTLSVYEKLKLEGLLLSDYLDQAIGNLALHPDVKLSEFGVSGLVWDVLHFFSSGLGTAKEHLKSDILKRYAHVKGLPKLLAFLQDYYLITEQPGDHTSNISYRLSHDALAPLVRENYDRSGLPGQRARRILENRLSKQPQENEIEYLPKKLLLDKTDYYQVLSGRMGMRIWTITESKLVEQSGQRLEHQARQKRRLQKALWGFGCAVMLFALVSIYLWQNAVHERNFSEARRLVSLSVQESQKHKYSQALGLIRKATEKYGEENQEIYKALLELFSNGFDGKLLLNTTYFPISKYDPRFIRINPDKKLVLIAQKNDSIVLLTSSGEMIYELSTEGLLDAQISPDGEKILLLDYQSVKLLGKDGVLLKTHQVGQVNKAIISFEGNHALLYGSKAWIWNFLNDHLIELDGHTRTIISASISQNGNLLLTTSRDSTAILWNSKGERVAFIETPGTSRGEVSPDGATIHTISYGATSKIWDFEGNLKSIIKQGIFVDYFTFSPDGKYILTALNDTRIKIWNTKGNLINTISGNTGLIRQIAFSPDGRYLLRVLHDGKMILSYFDGEFLTDLSRLDGSLGPIGFSNDEEFILTISSPKAIRGWEFVENPVTTIEDHYGLAYFAQYLKGSSQILSTSSDGTIKFWDTKGKLLRSFDSQQGKVPWQSIQISVDEKYLLSYAHNNSAILWKLDGQIVAELDNNLKYACFSPDKKHVLTLSHNSGPKLWDLSGRLIYSFNEDWKFTANVIFSPDGQHISTHSGKQLRIWNINGELKAELTLHDKNSKKPLLFLDDTRMLVTTGDTIRIMDLSGKILNNLGKFTNSSYSTSPKAILSPNGKYLLTFPNENVGEIWGIEGFQIAAINNGKKISSGLFSPDSDHFLTIADDFTMRLWSVDGEKIADLKGHTDKINRAVFSHDGHFVLTGSSDGTAKLWNLKGEILIDYDNTSGEVFTVQFSQDDRFILAAHGQKVTIWPSLTTLNTWLDNTPSPPLTAAEKKDYRID